MAAKQPVVEEVEEVVKKKGGNGLVIIMAVMIVLLVGGMVAMYFIMNGGEKDGDASSDETYASADQVDAGSSTIGADAFRAKPYPPKYKQFNAPSEDARPIYFVMDKFVVNFNGDGQAKFLAVDLQFMSYYPQVTSDTGEMQHLLPMLKNDIQRLLRNQYFNELNTAEGPDKLRAEILEVARKILDKHNIYPDLLLDVYMTRFVMQ